MTGAFPVPLTLPVANGLFQPLNGNLTSWAAITRGANFDTFAATPSLSNLNLLIGSTMLTSGGALGTPSSGTVTNLTGTASININGTVGATTPAAGSFTTGAFSGILNSTNTTSATTSLLGAVVIGNGTAATSVGIGGGRLEVGTSLKAPYFAASTAQYTQNGTGIAHVTQFGSTTNLNALQLGGTTKGLRLVMASDGNVTLTDSTGTASTGNLTVNNSIVGGTLTVTGNSSFTTLAASGATTLGSHLTFASDNAFDIGAAASGRPRAIYAVLINAVGTVNCGSTLAASGTVTEGGSAAGAVKTQTRLVKAVSTIADNTATAVLTVTIPNAAHTASLRVRICGALGGGGAIGAREATGTIAYDIAISRTAGVNAVATISAAYGSATSNVAGGGTIAVTAALSAISGAVGASNTFTVDVTIDDTTGAATSHTCQVVAECANAAATGITIA